MSSRSGVCEELLRRFRELPVGSIWLVRKEADELTILPATQRGYTEWMRLHQGFFGKFSLEIDEWDKADHVRSIRLIGGYKSTFYVQVLSDGIKTYPSS